MAWVDVPEQVRLRYKVEAGQLLSKLADNLPEMSEEEIKQSLVDADNYYNETHLSQRDDDYDATQREWNRYLFVIQAYRNKIIKELRGE